MKKINKFLMWVFKFCFGAIPKEEKSEYYVNSKGEVKKIIKVTTD